MITATTDEIVGKKIKTVLGVVFGTAVSPVGVPFRMYNKEKALAFADAIDDARHGAVNNMTREAAALGADAIVEMRLSVCVAVSNDVHLIQQITAYGTAVKLEEG